MTVMARPGSGSELDGVGQEEWFVGEQPSCTSGLRRRDKPLLASVGGYEAVQMFMHDK